MYTIMVSLQYGERDGIQGKHTPSSPSWRTPSSLLGSSMLTLRAIAHNEMQVITLD